LVSANLASQYNTLKIPTKFADAEETKANIDFVTRAGAHWRSHANKSDLELQQWDKETYKHMQGVIENEKANPTGGVLSGLALRKSRYFRYASAMMLCIDSPIDLR
jgi:hypothetical protein